MNKQYNLEVPSNIICGCGTVSKLAQIVQARGVHSIAIIIDGGVLKSGVVDETLKQLQTSVLHVTMVSDVPPEPEDRQVMSIYEEVKNSGAELIIAIGGGSVMDTSKFVAVMLKNPEFLADLSNKELIREPGVPLIVVPTSAGTGSEATPNAIVLIPAKKLKVGVVHKYFLPSQVVLDPELTKSLPQAVTASTGLDAFCHCIETYISKKGNPFCDMFALEGLRLISANLRRAYNDGNDIEARENMLRAAFYGGVAISCSSTVAVHALSYPLGGAYRIPHGISNAILLPYVMAFNMDAIPDKVLPIANAMGIDTQGLSVETAGKKVIDEIFSLAHDVNIPDNLEKYGITPADLEFLTKSASEVHRLLDQNPKAMTLDDIRSIYKQLL
jgi:Alcohol dehydrogenase, class IV